MEIHFHSWNSWQADAEGSDGRRDSRPGIYSLQGAFADENRLDDAVGQTLGEHRGTVKKPLSQRKGGGAKFLSRLRAGGFEPWSQELKLEDPTKQKQRIIAMQQRDAKYPAF